MLQTLMPNLRLGAHVDVFKEDHGERVLVQTSRRCRNCGKPLTGAVVPAGQSQVHMQCPRGNS